MRRRPEGRARAWIALVMAATMLAGGAAARAADDPEAVARRHGWGYLVDRLVADGLPRARVAQVFADPRVPPFDGLPFNLVPREARGPYLRLQSPRSVREARACRERHAEAFAAAERREGVPASVIAAIIHVESNCGRMTGSSVVLHRLARLAMANEPGNLADNLRRHMAESTDPSVPEVARRRARYLEDTFYPEVRAVFTIADRLGIDPLGMEGSPAGAFGYPQFLPTSYLRFGVDGDGDGRVSLYDMADAAASCARYLAQNGWTPDVDRAGKRAVIWRYNRSEVYIDTILALDRHLRAPDDSPPEAAPKRTRPRRR